jgi:Sulfate permease and related transporters (MFS superfamily)
VNEIDASAVHALELINYRLKEQFIRFHLSEVKGPVMDRLHKVDFLQHLNGKVFLTQYGAYQALVGRGEEEAAAALGTV